jgi:hypothetical protein
MFSEKIGDLDDKRRWRKHRARASERFPRPTERRSRRWSGT